MRANVYRKTVQEGQRHGEGIPLILVIDINDDLTVREQQVLYYIARGDSNKEISTKLNLSEQTVKVHLANMLGKTQSANRAALVSYGFEHGILRSR